IGLGVQLELPILPSFGGVLAIGFLPTIGGKRYIEQKVETKHKKGHLPLPLSLQQLQKWLPNDRMILSYTGGVTFFANFGIEPIVHVGPLYYTEGNYQMELIKKGENDLFVNIQRTRLHSVAMEANSGPISLSAGLFT